MFQHKVYISCMALAAAFMSACSSDSADGPVTDGVAMTFSAFEESSSRALTTNDSFLADGNSFAVWGAYKSSYNANSTPVVAFDATEITRTGGSWSYSPLQYWFPGQTYSFIAIHPYTEAATAVWDKTASTLSITHNVKESKSDLLAATHTRATGEATSMAPVSLNFKHLLAVVQFTATVDPAVGDDNVIIKSVKVYGIPSEGSCIVKTADDSFVWSLDRESVTTSESALANASDIEKSSGETFGVFTDGIMMIPQQIPNNATFEIAYCYKSDQSDAGTRIYKTNIYNISMSLRNGWEAGRYYNYKFIIGSADYITFSAPVVAEWEDFEGGNYIIQ